MRAVVQRVSRAKVTVDGLVVGEIGPGLLVLVGAGQEDTADDIQRTAKKILELRIFADGDGKMNLSVLDIGGQVLAVSQFTLYGDCRKGRRPSFVRAMRPPEAETAYEEFVANLRAGGVDVATGRFGARMDVELVNDGPVTLLLDSHRAF